MNYRVMYLRDSYSENMFTMKMNPGAPIGCVVIKVNRADGELEYQLSVLNPQDRFDREVARSLALGRLTELPMYIPINRNANMHDITEAVMRDIAEGGFPSRAVKSAKLWLRTNAI